MAAWPPPWTNAGSLQNCLATRQRRHGCRLSRPRRSVEPRCRSKAFDPRNHRQGWARPSASRSPDRLLCKPSKYLHDSPSGTDRRRKLPFRGNTGFEVTAAILSEPPPPLPATVPHGLAAVIQRCLMKVPAERYQQASEVRAALEALQGAVLQSRHPSEETRGPRTLVLRGMQHLSVKNRDVLLLVGTNKGAFLLKSSRDRTRWDTAGPYFHGQGGRVEMWRGGLGSAYLLPALSAAGASLSGPCSVSTSRSSNRTGLFQASGSRRRLTP
jgi:hypothetical protein